MIILQILTILGLPLILGLSFLRSLRADESLPLTINIPLGFGLGMGFLSHWMLLLTALHIKYSIVNIHLPLIIFAVALWKWGQRGYQKKAAPAPSVVDTNDAPKDWRHNLFLGGLSLYIIYMLGFVCVRALMVPVMEWDAISWIALKGKMLFYEQGVYPLQWLPNSAYPLHIPLNLAWVALNLGEWSETWVKMLFPTSFVLFAMFFYGVARLYLNKIWATGSLALLLSVNFAPYHATIAYRDTIMMFYFCMAILTILLWLRGHNERMLLVTAIFLGLGSFVKLEGGLYLGLGLTVLTVALWIDRTHSLRQRLFYLARSFFVAGGIFMAFFVYKKFIGATGATQDTSFISAAKTLGYGWNLLTVFFKELFFSANWHMLWCLFFLSLLRVRCDRNASASFVLAGTVLLFLLLYFSLGMFTGIYVSLVGLGSSSVLSRILLHVYPLAVLSVTIGFSGLKTD